MMEKYNRNNSKIATVYFIQIKIRHTRDEIKNNNQLVKH